MESSTVGLIATTLVTLLSGISVFFSPFVGGISALMHYLPSAALSVASGISAANFVLANGCCICIPIPLVFGALALSRRANTPALEAPLSQREADR